MSVVKVVDTRGTKDGSELKNKIILNMQYTDDVGKMYAGDFTVRRLRVGDLSKVAVRKAQLNGGQPEDAIDLNTRLLNTMLAHLEQAIESAPEWWKPLDFYDSDPIVELYEKVISYEVSFREPLQGQPQGTQASGQGKAEPVTARPAAMVDAQVSVAADV